MFLLILLHEGIPCAFITLSHNQREDVHLVFIILHPFFYYYKLAGSFRVGHAKTFFSTLGIAPKEFMCNNEPFCS